MSQMTNYPAYKNYKYKEKKMYNNIVSITLKIGGVTITVGVDDLKELRDELNRLFPTQSYPVWIQQPQSPWRSDPYRPYWWSGATWSATSGNIQMTANRTGDNNNG